MRNKKNFSLLCITIGLLWFVAGPVLAQGAMDESTWDVISDDYSNIEQKSPEEIRQEEEEIRLFFEKADREAAESIEAIKKAKAEQQAQDEFLVGIDLGSSTVPAGLIGGGDSASKGDDGFVGRQLSESSNSDSLLFLGRSVEWLSIFVILQFLLIGVLFYIILTRRK